MKIKLIFKIDENYLIAHTLSSTHPNRFSSNKHKKEIVDFQNFAWKKSNELYSLITGIWIPGTIVKKVNNLPKYLNLLKKNSKYKKILSQTKRYLEFCKRQWDENYEFTFKNVKEITGLNLNKNFVVYITHPSLKNGLYLGKNRIAWGHNEDWKNYATVYLWHEILHSYLPTGDIGHAIIELVADEELRIRLNKGHYGQIDCHEYLKPIKKKIMLRWRKYLEQKNKDIKKFNKRFNKK